MTMRERIFWSLSVLGAALPLAAVLPWFQREGLNLPLFFRNVFDGPVEAMFGLDVIITALVVFAFAFAETSRLKISLVWLPLAGCLLIGPSFGLPAFLALRERALARNAPPA